MEQKDLQHIVCQFEIQGNVAEVKPLGNGLINTTYLVETEGDAPNYVLQHVNNAIFPRCRHAHEQYCGRNVAYPQKA